MADFFHSFMRVSVCLTFLSFLPATILSGQEPSPSSKSKLTEAERAVAAKIDEKSVQEVAAVAKKSVVVITFTGRDGQRQGLGSGFIISNDGLIATNMHVIGEARPIHVELHDGRKFDVKAVHATERSQDLALLKIDAQDLPVLPLGNSDELQDGQQVIAIGNPLGLERSVVSGVLSGRREIEGRSMLQIALPIERGNSGGPLLDLRGHVHGLLTLKSLKTDNLGFAMAVNSLKPLLEKPNPIPMSRWLTIGVIDPDQWTVLPGARWRQRSGQIAVEGRGGGFGGRALCLATEPPPAVPFELAVQVKYEPTDGAAGLVFHSDGGDKHYGFYPSSGGVRLSRFEGPDVYSWAVLREVRSPHLKRDGWNSLKVRVEEDRILCYLNGELVIESKDATYKSGLVGLCKFRHTEAEYKGFRVAKQVVDTRPNDELLGKVTKVVEGLTSDDAAVSAAAESLAKEDDAVVGTLEQRAKELEQRASQLRRVAVEVHTRKTLAEFEAAVRQDNVDLLEGALLISRLDNPELDIANYKGEVERHAKRIIAVVGRDATEEDRLVALNRYLFEEQGFHGSRTDYSNRSNSYVNEVLDDREGLPITLSVLYIEIARKIGLNVVAVGMPSHFLARHEPKQGKSQLIDVFNRGRLLTPEEARKMCEELNDLPWQDSFLNSISAQATLERMLRNLFNVAAESRETERMLRYTDAALILKPDSAHDHLLRGILSYQSQRMLQARREVDWLNEHKSDVNQETIDELARAIARGVEK